MAQVRILYHDSALVGLILQTIQTVKIIDNALHLPVWCLKIPDTTELPPLLTLHLAKLVHHLIKLDYPQILSKLNQKFFIRLC